MSPPGWKLSIWRILLSLGRVQSSALMRLLDKVLLMKTWVANLNFLLVCVLWSYLLLSLFLLHLTSFPWCHLREKRQPHTVTFSALCWVNVGSFHSLHVCLLACIGVSHALVWYWERATLCALKWGLPNKSSVVPLWTKGKVYLVSLMSPKEVCQESELVPEEPKGSWDHS